MTFLSFVLWTLYHKKSAGQFINSVLQCCLDGKSLLRRRGYLPLTEYSKHPFRLVTRALGGKREKRGRSEIVCNSVKKTEISMSSIAMHTFLEDVMYLSLLTMLCYKMQCSESLTCLCWTAPFCVRVLLHGHEEVESSFPALLMKRWGAIQTGDCPWIHILLSHRDPGTPISVLSQGVECISMQEPILK